MIHINIAPTTEDYDHAWLVHATWGNLKKRRGLIWLSAVIGFIIAWFFSIVLPDTSDGQVTVSTFGLIFLSAYVPAILWFILTRTWLTRNEPIPGGIVEHRINVTTQSKQARRGLLGWIIFLVLALLLYWMFSRTPQFQLDVAQGNLPSIRQAPPVVSLALMILMTIVGTVLPLVLLSTIQRKQNRERLLAFKALLLPREWNFTEEELIESGPLLISRMKWSYIIKFLETPRVIMLYPNESAFYLVPKSAFQDEQELARFLGLLTRKVPTGITQPRQARGFEIQTAHSVP